MDAGAAPLARELRYRCRNGSITQSGGAAVFALNGIEFSLVEIIVWLIVAAICGAIGEALVGYSPGGLLASIGIGLVGAFLGSWLARALGLPALLTFTFGDVQIELIWTILGAALLVGIVALLRRPRRYRRRYS
jgi:uncharacterized membrane protein YeaQ/YmgE (transglycosylase-associated protein family)